MRWLPKDERAKRDAKMLKLYYELGLSATAIAERFNCSNAIVFRALEKHREKARQVLTQPPG